VKKKNDAIAILFVTIVAIAIWFWAYDQTKIELGVTTTLRFRPPEGSTSTVVPDEEAIFLTLRGPRSAVEKAHSEIVREGGLDLTVVAPDGEYKLLELPTKISALSVIRNTGAEVSSTDPTWFVLDVQTMDLVEATIHVDFPGVTISGDPTFDPETVTLHIPRAIRDELPEAIAVTAVISDAALEQLQPGFDNTEYASIRLPPSLDSSDVTIDPIGVNVTFKIQSKTQKWEIPFVRVLIAGPAEEYAAFSITLPRVIVPKVEIESDTDIIDGIKSGKVTVFAIVRLKSSELEDRITEKAVTTFLAFTEDGAGHVVKATVENPAMRNIELKIEKIEKKEEIAE